MNSCADLATLNAIIANKDGRYTNAEVARACRAWVAMDGDAA